MTSPWTSSPAPLRRPAERPWMGLALLLAVPFLSLILIRILWSGSTLWFFIAGVLMLGWAAYAFLSRRSTPSYGYQTLSPEPNKMPLVLFGIGALFLALLILPHASSGSGSPAARLNTSNPNGQLVNSLPVGQPTATPQQTPRATARATPAPTPSESDSSSQDEQTPTTSTTGGETYVVQDGDTLWDIASRYGVSVDDIVSANNLANAADLTLGQEIVIPAASADGGTADTAAEPEATPSG